MVRKKIKIKVSPSTHYQFISKNSPAISGRKLLMIFVFIIAIASYTVAQVSDTLAIAGSRSSTLKYLKSMALEEQEKCDKTTFLEKYNIDLTCCKEARIIKKSQFKKGPSDEAENCKVVLTSGTIVKLYNYYPEEKYWAVKYENKWGFLPDSSVKGFE